jgi:hypothetical protein
MVFENIAGNKSFERNIENMNKNEQMKNVLNFEKLLEFEKRATLRKWDTGRRHKGIRHNLHFPSIWKGAETKRGIEERGIKEKSKNHFLQNRKEA